MKDKIKNIIEIIIVAAILLFPFLTFPFNVSVKNGETVCSNILGTVVKCR